MKVLSDTLMKQSLNVFNQHQWVYRQPIERALEAKLQQVQVSNTPFLGYTHNWLNDNSLDIKPHDVLSLEGKLNEEQRIIVSLHNHSLTNTEHERRELIPFIDESLDKYNILSQVGTLEKRLNNL